MAYFQATRTEATPFRSRREPQNNKWQRNQNTVVHARAVAMGPITHTIVVALMVAVLGLIYLAQVTKTSTYGYTLQGQSEELASLTAEQQELEIENARLQALNTIKDSTVATNMTTPVSTTSATN